MQKSATTFYPLIFGVLLALFLLSPWIVSAQVIGAQPYFTETITQTYGSGGCTNPSTCTIESLSFTLSATTTVDLLRVIVQSVPTNNTGDPSAFVYIYHAGEGINQANIVYAIASTSVNGVDASILYLHPYGCMIYGCLLGAGEWEVGFAPDDGSQSGTNFILRGDSQSRPYYTLSATSSISGPLLSDFVTNNLELFATSTVSDFCDTNIPYDNSSIIQATITYVPNGLCRAAIFLFVPSEDSLNQFGQLSDVLSNRIPFSYVVQTIDFVTSFTPSSTSSVPSLTISTGTSTPIHVSAEVFSTSTLTRFIGTTRMAQLRALMSLGIYLSFATAMYFSIKHLLR